jgi:hypothetical protein
MRKIIRLIFNITDLINYIINLKYHIIRIIKYRKRKKINYYLEKKDEAKATYKSRNIFFNEEWCFSINKIQMWEKILSWTHLREKYWKNETGEWIMLVWVWPRWNVYFENTNTIIARKNMKNWEKLRLYAYPKWNNPLLFCVPNYFIFYILYFFSTLVLLIGWILIFWVFFTYIK